ncbi:ring finger domain-containing protein [Ditylenchus destructor]|uniref:Ring finger domain-containing protein n=1 Tax=Ditylenchus destructor TaxID=166010 RepID=A0AAD4N1U7_9BILA|nr:ring finger domain-containing protein [Ditylenchus destructor]
MNSSSYVNELYVNSTLGGGAFDEEGSEGRAMDEKRKARVRGLLEQIPVDVYTEGGKGDDECAICMVDFVDKEPIRFLPCMHSYHVKCIDDWLLRSFTCPSCMEPVDSAILSAFTVNTSTNLASFECSPATAGSTSK